MIPAFAADETAALRTKWALKMPVSIPDLVSMVLIHLAIVDDPTGLYGLINPIKRCDLLETQRRSLVLSSYARKVFTGHNLCGKAGNNSDIGFDCLDCLANFVGNKVTPSGLYLRC